mmetsp:Transcript_105812/g.329900  ORF Transcript_105812/g.329900 Transcript_105812/m.329900 type:complete len:292 (+) Transcript_105812:576-1451(+)
MWSSSSMQSRMRRPRSTTPSSRLARCCSTRLCASFFARCRHKEISSRAWLDKFGSPRTVLMNSDDVVTVLAITDSDYLPVAGALARLQHSSRIGHVAFSLARDLAASVAFSRKVAESIEECESADFDNEYVQKSKAVVSGLALQLDNSAAHCKRYFKLTLSNMYAVNSVSEPLEEWELQLLVAMKRTALGQDEGLPLFQHERWVLREGAITKDDTFRATGEVYSGMLVARKLALQFIDTREPKCFDDVRKAIHHAMGALLALDLSFKVDALLLDNCETMVSDALLAQAPGM